MDISRTSRRTKMIDDTILRPKWKWISPNRRDLTLSIAMHKWIMRINETTLQSIVIVWFFSHETWTNFGLLIEVMTIQITLVWEERERERERFYSISNERSLVLSSDVSPTWTWVHRRFNFILRTELSLFPMEQNRRYRIVRVLIINHQSRDETFEETRKTTVYLVQQGVLSSLKTTDLKRADSQRSSLRSWIRCNKF